MGVIAVKQFTTAQEVRENARRINAARRASYTMPAPVAAPKAEPAPVLIEPVEQTAPLALTADERLIIMERRAMARASVSDIIAMVALFYDVPPAVIRGQARSAYVVQARHVSFYLSRTLTLKSLHEIGRLFGGYDHTSVLYAQKKIARRRLKERELDDELKWLERQLKPYNATQDFGGSIDDAYAAVRDRVAAGGPGWEPKL